MVVNGSVVQMNGERWGNGVSPLAAVRNLVVNRGSSVVLQISGLGVAAGEVLAVIGPNGAGKSTLLQTMALLLPPASGEIWFAGQRIDAGADLVRLRRRMAVVFQEPLLLDTTVKDNVASGLRIRGVSGREAEAQALYWMKRFGIDALARRQARHLSGGEAQRVSLARAFALKPELLLLDEPFSALDAPTRAALFEDFEQVLRDSGLTTIFVTHDRVEAQRLGDRVAVLIDGTLAQVGEPGEVFSSPASERVATFVGVENLIPGRVVEQRDGLATVDLRAATVQVVNDMAVGRRVLVGLRPEDVVLAPLPLDPQITSARNRIRGRIVRLTPLGSQVRVSVDCGFSLSALITVRSAEELGFVDGRDVLASFKASSAHLLPK